MNQAKVRYLVEEALAENETLFLIDLSISVNNKINVVIDGDEGVPLSECIRISRNVEHNLDREAEDFSLEVSTPDISKPIKLKRQYIKNIQRILKATTIADEEIEGILTALNSSTYFFGSLCNQAFAVDWLTKRRSFESKMGAIQF